MTASHKSAGSKTAQSNIPVGNKGKMPSDSSLEQVRELLFGAQLNEHQSLLRELESKFSAALSTLRSDLTEDLARREETLRHDMAKLVTQLQQETEQRQQAISEALQRLDHSNAALAGLDSREASNHEQLLAKMNSETTALQQLIHQQYDGLTAQLQQTTETLQQKKADREQLAQWLSDMAAGLQDSKITKS